MRSSFAYQSGSFRPQEKVQPVVRATEARKLAILPPWPPGDGDGGQESPFGPDDPGDELNALAPVAHRPDDPEDGGDPSLLRCAVPSSVDVVDRPGDLEDDADLSLSLYVGAENARHRLCDVRSGYKDLSNISFAEVAVLCNDPARQDAFPSVLHHIVSCGRHGDSIRWLWHGRAFKIINTTEFFGKVAPWYCYSSPALFLELAEAYGFQRIAERDCLGAERITFYHERFLRFRPWIAYTMEPGRGRIHGNEYSSQRKPADQEVVLKHLGRCPALKDVVVPYSMVWEHHLLVQHQLFNVAHAYVPTPPLAHFDWHTAARERQRWGPRGW